jgi:FkbM family methyltransferase
MKFEQAVKKCLSLLIPESIKIRIRKSINGGAVNSSFNNEYVNLSFSQEGEDLVLARIFEGKTNGFYIDVGAHHPMRFSNTFKFYLQGWRGINIDALPGSMVLFNQRRPEDINLEVPISNNNNKCTYYMFNEPALNTFDRELADSRNNGKYRIIEQRDLQTYTLAEVLQKHLQPGQKIDFLTIDVEGLDVEVLESNNWSECRPEYIVTECFGTRLNDVFEMPVNKLLEEKGYSLFAKTVNSLIYENLL